MPYAPTGIIPPDQTLRQIGFELAGGGTGAAQNLVIRPEELTRLEPSRLAVQQTLAGAWADSFGRGVISIRLAGTTGWRGAGGVSGEAAFQALNQNAFAAWHAARAAIVAGGGDPNVVEMTFTDALDGHTDLVAPKSFTLRRSKSSPLLMRYVIELLVLQPADMALGAALDPIAAGIQNPLGYVAGAAALAGGPAGGLAAALGVAAVGVAGAFGL